MYDSTRLVELSRFARVHAGSTVMDVWPGSGDWTRLFSDIVAPEGRVYSFVPAELAHFKSDPVGQMRALAKEPERANVQVVSADLVALPESLQTPAELRHLSASGLSACNGASENSTSYAKVSCTTRLATRPRPGF
jgi:predicted methyltransferase|nr:hypothetical protein [Peristeroidobacter soli]